MGSAIGVFARDPIPGRTKTRLIPLLGPEGATRFYVASLLDTIEGVRAIECPFTVFATPARARHRLRKLGVAAVIEGQGPGTLGQRMERALRRLLGTDDFDGAILIGSDSPDLPRGLLRAALESIRRHPTVLIPAFDGGFALVGVRRATIEAIDPGELFRGVPWSARDTLEATVARWGRLGLRTELLDPWWDVDDPDDLRALAARTRDHRKAGRPTPTRTTAFLEELGLLG